MVMVGLSQLLAQVVIALVEQAGEDSVLGETEKSVGLCELV